MGNLKNALCRYKQDHPDLVWADIAESIGITLASLVNYLAEKVTPRESTLQMISKVLEIPVDELRDDVLDEIDQEDLSEGLSEDPDDQDEDFDDQEDAEEDPEEDPDHEEKTEVHISIGEMGRVHTRPPIGVKPYYVASIQRIQELADAISRNPGNMKMAAEWACEILEQVELTKRMRKRWQDEVI
jgi:transcriptional regulator with XRE-family HTH domain